jgi:hypothetical protein
MTRTTGPAIAQPHSRDARTGAGCFDHALLVPRSSDGAGRWRRARRSAGRQKPPRRPRPSVASQPASRPASQPASQLVSQSDNGTDTRLLSTCPANLQIRASRKVGVCMHPAAHLRGNRLNNGGCARGPRRDEAAPSLQASARRWEDGRWPKPRSPPPSRWRTAPLPLSARAPAAHSQGGSMRSSAPR